MKNKNIVSILAILAVCGCQVKELNEVISESKVFTATVEDNFSGSSTRTSLDDQGNVLFKKSDQISIFIGSTINEQFQVTDDSDGKTSASLIKVTGSGFVAGGEIESNVAFYPYASATTIAKNESSYVLGDITLPSVQYYAEGSFGNGAFPMAAVTTDTDDMHLKFKNVLGGLKLQLTGTATITSIRVTGNNDEILCGAAEVTVSNTTTPTINLTNASAKTVTLNCGDGVQLNSETATSFIIALPPMTMESGFTVVVTDTEGKQMEIKTTKSQTINRTTLLKMPEVAYEGTPAPNGPLTFMSTGETSIALTKVGSPGDITLEYKIGTGNWMDYTIGEAVSLNDGQTVSFRAGAEGNDSFSKSYNDYYHFVFSGSGTVAAHGNIMSLVSQEETLVIPSEYYFGSLFRNCTSLTTAPELPAITLAPSCYFYMFDFCRNLNSAPELPATTLRESCYAGMFRGCSTLSSAPALPATTLAASCYSQMFAFCTSLTAAPELPATALAERCYEGMFRGCSGLTTAPNLPATSLVDWCYHLMFSGCTGLTVAPELPATTLAGYCYYSMFDGCTGLTTAPELPATNLSVQCYCGMFARCTGLATAPALPATTLAVGCYMSMFEGCTGLTVAPELPATTLDGNAYFQMFRGCTGLSTAPVLPATRLAIGCYSVMFEGCTGLTVAPELPAMTLKEACYWCMFMNCTNLTAAPVLPATRLVIQCYDEMFSGCNNLKYIKMLATNISATDCLKNWVSGVAPAGTFVKNPTATWNLTGTSGIPEGWTVYPTGLPSNAEAVDLGLSIKWANMNVGATSPEEYGGYFAWGETEPKADYSWKTYKWCNGTNHKLTKYNKKSSFGSVDNKTTLDLEDDAAHVNWGGTWRMPISAEVIELINNCTAVWTTENGVNGRRFTSKKEGYTDKSIFIPAAGDLYGYSLNVVGSSGYIWSSSLNINPDSAVILYFHSGKVDWGDGYRNFGISVRPVCD